MTNKTFTRLVAVMTIAIAVLFFGLVKVTYGNEVMPEPKPNNPIINTVETVKKHVSINEPNNKVTVFIKNEWEDIKEYQRHSWHEGKEQLAKNKQQISGFFDTLAEALSYYAPKSNESSDTENR